MDKICVKYDNFVFLGDLNYDLQYVDKCKSLMEICTIFYFTNMVKEPSCFKSKTEPSLIEVILTNMPDKCIQIFNFNCGFSDFHNMICFQLNSDVPRSKSKWIKYRSLKKL